MDQPALEIQVKNLHKSFGENHVLKGVNLEIKRGELVAIVGSSGSGKTVLLQHLIGRMRPDEGSVLLADHESPGEPLTDLATLDDQTMDRLRRHWAVVFQKNALFTGSVYDNIALGLADVKGMEEPEIQKRVHDVIESVDLDAEHVPQLDREELSGGMAKRVAIARALALDPVLIFYDEPTTGLDPEHAEQIQDLIRDVHRRKPEQGKQRTTLIITHDMSLLSRLEPRIVMLNEGKIFFDGALDAFRKSKSPPIQPYLEMMPVLHNQMPGTRKPS
ncbi:MAG TPA: ATP-binding cassette domain-containing protein [Tepidisphaeraceae bacterium]|nr:ATP-binding cassette domain-containing protein [Tepidisphaeraceae bacterium]